MTDQTAFDWRQYLPVHPAAEQFPLMSQVGLKELADDIKENGLIDPIVTWAKDGNLLLDGRNRLDAMALAGLLGVNEEGDLCDVRSQRRIKLQYFTDGDPYAIALSLNVHRRHLTNEQKRDLIAKLLKAKPETSNRQIAEQVKVSHPTVAKVREQLEENGDVEKVTTSIDTKGRKQPAMKRKTATAVTTTAKTTTTVETAGKSEPKAVVAKDIALREFDGHVLQLLQMTSKAKVEQFANSGVGASQFMQLARFLACLAKQDDVAASAEAMKTKHEALDMATAS